MTKLKIGKTIGVKTGETISRAVIKDINPAETLLRVQVEGLQNEGVYTIKADSVLPAPRRVYVPKAAEAGTFNRYTFNWVTHMLSRKAIPERVSPPPYTPEIWFDARWPDNTGYAVITMAVKVPQCPNCGRLMSSWAQWKEELHVATDLTPVMAGPVSNGKTLCVDCSRTVKEFECYLCNNAKTRDEIRETYGLYYLCQDCFETVSAKVWDETKDKLMDMTYSD